MWDGKNKAITFSYDDGVVQDQRFLKILEHYGLKATFNLNSGLIGREENITLLGKTIPYSKVRSEEVRSLYDGHEVAVHTLTHPRLTQCDEKEVIRQVEEDRLRLSDLTGYEVKGMAYPCGGVNHDQHIAGIIRKHTGVRYARTVESTMSFELPEDMYQLNGTVHHVYDMNGTLDTLFRLGEQFLAMNTDRPQLFYIWGHSYEFDLFDAWERMEEFCAMISGQKDVFYGTNGEILL